MLKDAIEEFSHRRASSKHTDNNYGYDVWKAPNYTGEKCKFSKHLQGLDLILHISN